METWLTYIAALLMAEATAFTFASSGTLASTMANLTGWLGGIAAYVFAPLAFMTFASGIASLGKDRLEGKTIRSTVLWAVLTTALLSAIAAAVTVLFPQAFPVSSTAGGQVGPLMESYKASFDAFKAVSTVSRIFIPVVLLAWMLGAALKPSADVIRPAYTVMNSWSEVMYRIQRTATFFGGFFVYIAGTSVFLNIWQEKTIAAAPALFATIGAAALAVILVVLPLLYAIFTGFKRNPYGIIGRSIASLATGFVSSNIYASALVNESVSRSNLGVQKRFSSTVVPLSIIITRGGTAFVSILSTVTLLKTLGAELNLVSLAAVAAMIAVFSFTSSLSAGFEIFAVSMAALKVLKVETYGAEACLVALLPFLNGVAVMLDSLLANMAASIASVRSRTDAKIPLKETI